MELAAIHVPTVVEDPSAENESDDSWIISYADWLLNLALRSAPAGLRAEMTDSADRSVPWVRFSRTGDREIVERLSHAASSALFRTVLARFAHHFSVGSLYGGSCERILLWRNQEFRTRFDISNSLATGFRIQFYAEPSAKSDVNTNTIT